VADYYKVLGVDKSADVDAIKKSPRPSLPAALGKPNPLSRTFVPGLKYHPDRNKGDKGAEDKFKEISEAYAVLSDEDKRKQYDNFGDSRFHQQYSQEDIFRNTDFGTIFQEFDLGGLDSIFGRIFSGGSGVGFDFRQGGRGTGGGRGHPGHAGKGQDVEYPMPITLLEAFHGGERQVSFRLEDGTERHLKVRVPRGAKDGGRLRVAGKGAPSPYGGPAGDLIVVLQMAGHPKLTLSGEDLEMHLPLRISEALLGATREVETLDGIKKVKIPAGVKPGTKVRLKGLGFPKAAGKDGRGDFYVVVDLDIPKKLTQTQKDAALALQHVDL